MADLPYDGMIISNKRYLFNIDNICKKYSNIEISGLEHDFRSGKVVQVPVPGRKRLNPSEVKKEIDKSLCASTALFGNSSILSSPFITEMTVSKAKKLRVLKRNKRFERMLRNNAFKKKPAPEEDEEEYPPSEPEINENQENLIPENDNFEEELFQMEEADDDEEIDDENEEEIVASDDDNFDSQNDDSDKDEISDGEEEIEKGLETEKENETFEVKEAEKSTNVSEFRITRSTLRNFATSKALVPKVIKAPKASKPNFANAKKPEARVPISRAKKQAEKNESVDNTMALVPVTRKNTKNQKAITTIVEKKSNRPQRANKASTKVNSKDSMALVPVAAKNRKASTAAAAPPNKRGGRLCKNTSVQTNSASRKTQNSNASPIDAAKKRNNRRPSDKIKMITAETSKALVPVSRKNQPKTSSAALVVAIPAKKRGGRQPNRQPKKNQNEENTNNSLCLVPIIEPKTSVKRSNREPSKKEPVNKRRK